MKQASLYLDNVVPVEHLVVPRICPDPAKESILYKY